jgi:hypothetical protein
VLRTEGYLARHIPRGGFAVNIGATVFVSILPDTSSSDILEVFDKRQLFFINAVRIIDISVGIRQCDYLGSIWIAFSVANWATLPDPETQQIFP